MNETYYLVDNNALLELGKARRATTFFHRYCRVTADVAREAGTRARSLPAPIPMTPRALEFLIEIMSELDPAETDLVDLFRNKGAADPGMVATVLALRAEGQELLLPDTWVLISHDKAVLGLAERYELLTLKPQGLIDMITTATAAPSVGVDPTS